VNITVRKSHDVPRETGGAERERHLPPIGNPARLSKVPGKGHGGRVESGIFVDALSNGVADFSPGRRLSSRTSGGWAAETVTIDQNQMGGKHYNIIIEGKVQGVWYRASARREALRLGLTGFVRNLADGRVYAEAEGPEEALEAFVSWCRSGPELASVRDIQVESGAIRGFEGFEVRRET
jgi:acylphosphatase